MDLWIRSQDKNILEKVNKLYVATCEEENGFGIYDIRYDDLDDCDVPLGFYKTKERALEVLDEIHNLLKPKGILKFNTILNDETIQKISKKLNNEYAIFNNNVEMIKMPESIVYEMPSE